MKNYAALLRESDVPTHLHDGLIGYLAFGYPPGSFLLAVLMNDLRGAFAYADDQSASSLQGLVRWLYRHAPADAWGSLDYVDQWIAGITRPDTQVGL